MEATEHDATIQRQAARIAELEVLLAARDELILKLERRVLSLEKDSSNSSKPPSSDPPSAAKPKHPPKARKKKRRGGHKRRQRTLLDADRIDLVRTHPEPTRNPDLWERALDDAGEPLFRVLQQVDFDPDQRRFVFTEHRFPVHSHRTSGRLRAAARPPQLRGVGGQLFAPGMQAWVCSLKIQTHTSVRGIRRFVRETLGLAVSTGYLAKALRTAAGALGPAYERIAEVVRAQPVLHVDETGHKHAGQRGYSWVATCPVAALFRVGVSRATTELEALVGSAFTGTLVSDFYAPYRRFARGHEAVGSAFCWAHLIREVKAVEQLPEENAKI